MERRERHLIVLLTISSRFHLNLILIYISIHKFISDLFAITIRPMQQANYMTSACLLLLVFITLLQVSSRYKNRTTSDKQTWMLGQYNTTMELRFNKTLHYKISCNGVVAGKFKVRLPFSISLLAPVVLKKDLGVGLMVSHVKVSRIQIHDFTTNALRKVLARQIFPRNKIDFKSFMIHRRDLQVLYKYWDKHTSQADQWKLLSAGSVGLYNTTHFALKLVIKASLRFR